MSRHVTVLSLLLSASSAYAAQARAPIYCNPSVSGGGYTSVRFEAILAEGQANLYFSQTDKAGKDVYTDHSTRAYAVSGDEILISLKPGDAAFDLRIPSAIRTTGLAQSSKLGQLSLLCGAYPFDLDGQKNAKYFNTVQLPAIPQSNPEVLKKSWMSSDGKFSFTATLYPDSPGTTHLPFVLKHTYVTATVTGQLIDTNPENAGSLSYTFYNPNHLPEARKIARAMLTDPTDVSQLRAIFGADDTTISLTHPYGHSERVNLRVQCGESSCQVDVRN